MLRCVLASLLLGLGMVSVASAQMPMSAGAPEVAVDRTLADALLVAGENASELENSSEGMDSPAKRDAMEFLIRYMPKRDLVALDAEFLIKQVEEAFAAREAHPWAAEVPMEIFHNDVLPYVVVNEKREDWRTDFRRRFSPVVKDSKTLGEAAMVVNMAIKEELKVDYSTKREKPDQSPSESMKSGLASCTGLSILLCDALRSVGIPARVAGTPSWTKKRGNHTWVEFYDPATGKWHFTDYYPDSNGVDHGWLIADAAKARKGEYLYAIYASSWKPTGRCFPLVWDMDINYVNAKDVTDRYISYGKRDGVGIPEGMGELRIDFVHADGRREAVMVKVTDAEDREVGEGVTPDNLADMNEFLTIRVKQGQKYSLAFFKEGEESALLNKQLVEIGDKRTVEIRGAKK